MDLVIGAGKNLLKTRLNILFNTTICATGCLLSAKAAPLSSDPSNFKVLPEKSTFYEIKTQSTLNI